MEKNTQLVPYEDVQKLATAVAQSGMFAAFKNPQQAFVLMMMAQVEGCHPMQAMQRYDVIQGKPAKKSDAMLADFQQRGGKVNWTEYTDEAVEAEFMSHGMDKPCKVRWTYKQAEAAGLTGKPTWKQFKRQMLKARVISEGVRVSDPGVVAGLYAPEEMGDFDVRPQAVTVEAQAIEAQVVEPQQPESLPAAPVEDAKAKVAKVHAVAIAIKEAGIPEADRKTWMSLKLGHAVESSKDLTMDELDTLHAAAKSAQEAQRGAA
jgi:hypothetical protein